MDRAIHLPPTPGYAPRRLEEGEFSPDLVKQIHPFVHVTVMSGLIFLYNRILDHPQLIWVLVFLVFISYSAPLMVMKIYAKGERMEQERSK
ncbi:hypothetical protein [Exiguobacterium sp. s183]|uniref:hypothetical protein n=1 Tax=Exiguobacterium sp. s183 TaxID=2751262 RepID=UPI001BED1EFB|nr:hypothetical protein [Exiguobacterium sp. s183]